MHPELGGTGHYFRVMRSDSSHLDGRAVLASAPVSGVGTRPADGTVALPRLSLGARFNLSRPRVALHPLAGPIALLTLIVGALAVVVFATSGPSSLVPRSGQVFPQWEAGPLHGLFGSLPNNSKGLGIGFSAVLAVMLVAYFVALAAVRTLSMRMIVVCVLALHAILLLSPPLMLTDLFNYLGYARLGGLHHLNPYTHVIAQEMHDPIYRFATWYHLQSPYGPLFTAASYPVAWLPLGLAYWTLKLAAVLGSLIFIALVWKCARLLGRDPRFAVLFVAANPVYLMYAIAGFHNDFFMLIPSTAAIALLLARRDRSAGAMVMVAVAVKFTAILLLPFLLVAARPSQRRKRVLVGALLASIPLVALDLALFGLSLPNLKDQSTLLTPFSAPNMLGMLLGVGGGTPGLLRLANVGLVVTVALVLRRRGEWLTGAGWSTLALIASLAWLVPWYVIWLLPLAALATSMRLRRATAIATLYVTFAFMPTTGMLLSAVHINLMGGSAGKASRTLQNKLEQ
jgi:alpha-1,6-mannosyltransferase